MSELIAEAIVTMAARIEALEKQNAELVKQIEMLKRADHHCAPEEHYHDEYASVDHVERSESSFEWRLNELRNDINNAEYRINDVERKAERAQSTADAAQRSARGG